MASTKDIGLTKGRRALLFTVLTLALICGLGFAYLGMPAVDLNQYVTAGLGRLRKDRLSARKKSHLKHPSWLQALISPPLTKGALWSPPAEARLAGPFSSRASPGFLVRRRLTTIMNGSLPPKHRFLRGSIPYRFLRSILQGSAVSRESKRAG